MRLAEHDDAVTRKLNLFCVKERDGWRVLLRPSWAPEHLAVSFDVHGEAFPVALDLDELDRHMSKAGARYERKPTTLGGVELTAEGSAAEALGYWFSTAIASGIRPGARIPPETDPEPTAG